MRHARLVLLSILFAVLVAMPVVAEDWTRFRGSNGVGTAA
jgi:hypothetical protein